jgi:hypothetical protein
MPDLITHATHPFSWSHQPGADCGVCHLDQKLVGVDVYSLADKLNIWMYGTQEQKDALKLRSHPDHA